MMELPKISVVMPVLNRADTVEKAINSVIDQQYPNLEFIILDGGSTDGTIDVIKKYEKYLTYWHSQYDGSPSIAVNMGIGKATGDLVVLFMADDWYLPGVLNKIAEKYIAYPQVDIFTVGGKIVNQNNEVILSYQDAKTLALSFYNVCFAVSAICCRFIKRSLYQREGVYLVHDEYGKHMFSNDKEFLLRVILNGATHIFIDFDGHRYLAHKESSTFGDNRNNAIKLCAEHQEIVEKYLHQAKVDWRHRLLLRYWYVDQSVRLVIFKLLLCQFKQAFTIWYKDIKKNFVCWILFSPVVVMQIVGKRVYRFLSSR